MNKPVLVIMAAGMGSRYGGLKQIDPVDEQGHIIMDFSIFGTITQTIHTENLSQKLMMHLLRSTKKSLMKWQSADFCTLL